MFVDFIGVSVLAPARVRDHLLVFINDAMKQLIPYSAQLDRYFDLLFKQIHLSFYERLLSKSQ